MPVREYELIQNYLLHKEIGAIRELFQQYEDKLFRYLWQMLRQQQDSEDALQETFRKALHALPKYREENHFKSWLYRIGHNTALDLIRKRKKIVEMDEVMESGLTSDEAGPGEKIETRERAEAVREAVAALPELERDVVTLRMQADLSFKEIAEIVGAPLGTVLARMHKAKQRLKKQLTPIITS